MNTKHTPGPWAMPDSGHGRISKVSKNGGWDGLIATADCGDYARSKIEGLANARLIAAAPDLLDALKRCGDYLTGPTAWTQEQEDALINDVHAAIAKATGSAT